MKPLRLLQINVGRGGSPHDLALALAQEEHIDVLLVQEPYIFHERDRRITKRHPSFECFTPTDNWTSRPRVLTYLRKGVGLQAEQVRPLPSNSEACRDLLFLTVMSPSGHNILIINIYNAPTGCTGEGLPIQALTLLPRAAFPPHTFLAGDFNLHHPRWQPSYQLGTSAADPLINWTDDLSFCLISEADTATHKYGNVLDLAFASGPLALAGAESAVIPQLDVTSDHLPLLSRIPWDQRFQEPQTRLRPNTLQQNVFLSLLKNSLEGLPSLPPNPLSSELDKAAESLSKAIQQAYQGSAKRSLRQGTGQPWWNTECRVAAYEYRTARREDTNLTHLDVTKRALRNTIRKAKRHFYYNKLNTATTGTEVFQMTKWHKSIGTYRSPPLKDPTRPDLPPATTLLAKRDVLARNLLQNVAEIGDIPLDSPTVPSISLPFLDITDTEVCKAVLNARNTAPREDEITTEVLRIGWSLIKTLVISLFQACIKTGYHPACFRTAILAILSKPKKPDQTSPRAYRPIALLSVLGKGLERLVARRMSWIAVHYKVLSKQQFGALPLRSAVDLTTCLTHDVETALNSNRTASLLTLDVKGAFDGVLPGRLIRRLREQGWPDCLVRWISAFATNRSVRIQLDRSIGPMLDIKCGLPQGSPVSPILFMLYIAPLFHLGKPRNRFGYADDVALLAVSPSLQDNATALTHDLQEILDWSTAEGITFDPDKSELLHFSRHRQDSDPRMTPALSVGHITVSENAARPYLRWLGVLFDKRLTFKWHVRTQAAKALKVSKALTSLGNTVRGVPSLLMRRAATACALPIAYYAAETWWPGRTRTGPRHQISNRVDAYLQLLSKVVLIAARAILPVYRTTPTAALHRESGLPPPKIALNAQALAATVRLRRLDPYHPLYSRARRIQVLARPSSRFARRILALPPSEQINPLATPPWAILETRDTISARIGAPRGISKEQCAQDFLAFLSDVPLRDIVLYSDGSKLSNGSAGAGFVAYQAGRQVLRQAIPLGTTAEVFDAEATAALAGLEAAIDLPSTRFATDLWICLDNLEVALRLLSPFPGSSQATFAKFMEAASKWQQRSQLPHIGPGDVRIRWVPGHTNVPGNEAADKAAKEGALLTPQAELPFTFASLRRWAKAKLPLAMDKLWKTVAPQHYRDLGIDFSPCRPKELSLPRATLGRILASRSGHGDFADYHERFNHDDAFLLCQCGARKAPLHFFFCRIAKRRMRRPPGPPTSTIPELLGTYTGAMALGKWLQQTQFYEDICPRAPSAE